MGVGGQRHVPAALPPGKIRYPLYRRLSGLQGLSGRGEENLAFTGIRSPDHPVRTESLYRLRYPRSVIYIHTIYSIYIYINIQVVWPFIKTPGVCSVLQQYTGCNRRNGPNFGRVFLMLNYTEKTQNTYIQS